MAQQPQACIHRGLTRADDHVSVAGVADPRQVVGRDALDAGGDGIGRAPHRRHDDLDVGGDDPPRVHRDVVAAERAQPPVAEVLAHRQVRHATRRQEMLAHHRVEVRADLGAAGQLVVAGVEAAVVDGVAAQTPRVHAVIGRRLMKPHERVGRRPVAPRLVVAIDHHDRGVRFGHHRVGEREPHRARTDDEVVGLDRSHRIS